MLANDMNLLAIILSIHLESILFGRMSLKFPLSLTDHYVVSFLEIHIPTLHNTPTQSSKSKMIYPSAIYTDCILLTKKIIIKKIKTEKLSRN
jgi:hypothetical protein